jgi:hypothetical protein
MSRTSNGALTGRAALIERADKIAEWLMERPRWEMDCLYIFDQLGPDAYEAFIDAAPEVGFDAAVAAKAEELKLRAETMAQIRDQREDMEEGRPR